MALPDPADHSPDCPAIEAGDVPALVVRFNPNRDASTCRVQAYEQCAGCGATTVYGDGRMPWRRFDREWRSSMAVWFATYEHRHNLRGRGTRTS